VIYDWLQAEERIHLPDLTARDLRRVRELVEQIEND
jgi:hypothetical protein